MERSIKHVESLVHATNVALAQMKFSLMFDDMTESKNRKVQNCKDFGYVVRKCFEEDDLMKCQDEFKSEAQEMLGKIDSIFNSNELNRKNPKALDRMKEINKKMKKLRPERSKTEETEQSREKLLSLISEEKFSPRITCAQSKHAKTVENKSTEKPSTTHLQSAGTPVPMKESPIKSKEELKSKILETEEIVSRGFRTARELAQKVETMSKYEKKEPTPCWDKTASEVSCRSLEIKSESNDTVSTVKCRRCSKLKRTKRDFKELGRVNAQIIDMIGSNIQEYRGPSLRLQRLPSLSIKGGLQLQKVHNLEIPAGGIARGKTNTSVKFLCHEKEENEELENAVQKLRKNNYCSADSNTSGNHVECCNCGKMMKIRESREDPKKVDEILRECNFNVFDPRIDEFVEKCGIRNLTEKPGISDAHTTSRSPEFDPQLKELRGKEKAEPKVGTPKKKGHLTLQGLSDRLLNKYKKETESIERYHFKVNRILQSLFREVDASREVFECCHFGKTEKEKLVKLSSSKPVLISLAGTYSKRKREIGKSEAIDKQKGKIESKNFCPKKSMETEEISLICKHSGENIPIGTNERSEGLRTITNLQELQEIEDSLSFITTSTRESNTSEYSKKKIQEKSEPSPTKQKSVNGSGKEETERKPQRMSPLRSSLYVRSEIDCFSDTLSYFNSDRRKIRGAEENIEEFRTSSFIRSVSKENMREEEKESEVKAFITVSSSKDTSPEKSEENYESDFESMTNEPEENGDTEKLGSKLSSNKLSTIAEVDSELERKLSEEQKAARNLCEFFEIGTSDIPEGYSGDITSKVKKSTVDLAESFPKNAPGELVSLNDILSALREQFARTESLAEKLAESSKEEKAEKTKTIGDEILSPWGMTDGSNFVQNLLSTRKDMKDERSTRSTEAVIESNGKNGNVSSGNSLSDEGGSSLGEIRLSTRRRSRRNTSRRSRSNSIPEGSFSSRSENQKEDFHFDVNVEEVLYSEGEIQSEELGRSVGEVLSEKNSLASSFI